MKVHGDRVFSVREIYDLAGGEIGGDDGCPGAVSGQGSVSAGLAGAGPDDPRNGGGLSERAGTGLE